jgi:hypothetical protein
VNPQVNIDKPDIVAKTPEHLPRSRGDAGKNNKNQISPQIAADQRGKNRQESASAVLLGEKVIGTCTIQSLTPSSVHLRQNHFLFVFCASAHLRGLRFQVFHIICLTLCAIGQKITLDCIGLNAFFLRIV